MRKIAFFAVIAVMGALAACPNPAPPAVSKGAAKLVIKENVHAKSIVPAIDMTIAAYDISGTGPDGSSVSISNLSVNDPKLSGSEMLLTDLWPGDWSFSISAKNSNSTEIGSWQGTGTITVNQTTEVDVTIDPLPGQGTLSLTIDLSSIFQQAPNLVITGSLVPAAGGEPIPLANTDFSPLAENNTRTLPELLRLAKFPDKDFLLWHNICYGEGKKEAREATEAPPEGGRPFRAG